MPTEKPSFYSVQGAAKTLGLSVTVIYRFLASGRLKEVKPEAGYTRLVDAKSVETFETEAPSREALMTVPVYTAKAAADELGLSPQGVYACLADGRLEAAVAADGGGVVLVTSASVAMARENSSLLSVQDPERLEFIRGHLERGITLAAVAKVLGISRERVRQLIEAYVPVEERKRQCALCGKPLPPEIAWARHTHLKCAEAKEGEDRRERGGRKGNHQRAELTPTEVIALKAYQERHFGISWVPHQAPFDFWVNGKRIDVKGARLGKDNRFQFGILAWRSKAQLVRSHYNDLEKRCDVFHCIGLDGDKTYHLMMPAGLLNGRVTIAWRPPSPGRGTSMWDEWCDRWDLLE